MRRQPTLTGPRTLAFRMVKDQVDMNDQQGHQVVVIEI